VRAALEGSHGEQQQEDLELALIRAATHGHVDCANLLLKHGVDVAAVDGQESTALIHAAEHGHLETVKLLLEHGCPINHQNSSGYTALMKVCENGHVDILELLLQNGATDMSDDVAVEHPGVPNGVPNGVKKLPRYMPHGHSCLMVTVLKQPENYKSILRKLLASNLNVNAVDYQDMTVLHHAANTCPEDVITLLLDAKVNIDAKDVWGTSALMVAAAYGKTENVRQLLKYGADVGLCCKSKRTALTVAVRTGSEELIQTLLDAGADPMARDAHNHTPLFIAILHNNYAAVKCMIKAGSDLDVVCRVLTTFQMMSCFECAVYKRQQEVVRMLYQAGACNNKMLYEQATSEQLKQQSTEFPDLVDELNKMASKPRSLQQTCRMVIRHTIQGQMKADSSYAVMVKKIELPKSLREYLLYSDINL